MRKILFSMAALAVLGCSGLLPGDDGDLLGGYTDNNINNYRTVQIGGQRWMAENLNYYVAGSKCYDNKPSNCEKYGRLYDWATAMALPSSCNSSYCDSQVGAKHQGICPTGWHIPSNAEWDALFRYADGDNGTESPYDSYTAGRYLKATDGWYDNGNGEDTYGFAALPGGYGTSDGYFYYVGSYGNWWSASEYNGSNAYYPNMFYNGEDALWSGSNKTGLRSVRCVMD